MKLEETKQTFSLICSVHESGAAALGMRGPFILFNCKADAADYLQDFADSLRRETVTAPPVESGNSHGN